MKKKTKKTKIKISKGNKILVGFTCFLIFAAIFLTVLNGSENSGYETSYYNDDYEEKEPEKTITREEELVETFTDLIIKIMYITVPLMILLSVILTIYPFLRRGGLV